MKIFPRPPFFPLMIDIKDREILIVGGGRVASRRAETLLRCGARVTAVSKDFIQDFPSDVIKIERAFHPSDIDERFLFVVAATNDRDTNELIRKVSNSKKILVNVCDCQGDCDFFFPSLISYENVAVSVSTAGADSGLTRRLSDRLRRVWASWVCRERELLLSSNVL